MYLTLPIILFDHMKKKIAIPAAGMLALSYGLSAGAPRIQPGTPQPAQAYYLIVGTYAPADSAGIYVFRFHPATGHADLVSTVTGIENPSFLTLSADLSHVYAVSETHGGKGGQVYAYAFDRTSGKLHFVNKRWSDGDDPCNIITDASGKWLFVSNYTSGSLSVFPLEKDGSLGAMAQHIQHEGHSVKPQQKSAHVHCVMPAPGGRDVFVTDLGMDRIFTYELNAKTGQLAPGEPPYTPVATGTGPRHIIFSLDGKFLYLIQELGGEVTVFRYEPGKLTQVQTLSNVPKDYHGRIWAADIHFSPDGKFLYAANRDDLNDIVIYAVDQTTGKLTYQDRVKTGGQTARNFTLSPAGKYLLVGHQNGPEIHVFNRDAATGGLTRLNTSIPVPHAVCLKMCPVE